MVCIHIRGTPTLQVELPTLVHGNLLPRVYLLLVLLSLHLGDGSVLELVSVKKQNDENTLYIDMTLRSQGGIQSKWVYKYGKQRC